MSTINNLSYMIREIQKLIDTKVIKKVLIFIPKKYKISKIDEEIIRDKDIIKINGDNKKEHYNLISKVENMKNAIIISRDIIGVGVNIPTIDSIFLSYDALHKQKNVSGRDVKRDKIGRGNRIDFDTDYNNIIYIIIIYHLL